VILMLEDKVLPERAMQHCSQSGLIV